MSILFNLKQYLRTDICRSIMIANSLDAYEFKSRNWFSLFSPRLIPVLFCRLAHWAFLKKFFVLAKFFSLINFFLFGIEISIRCPIGKGLYLPHTQGTVIGAWSIGDNATIFQGVTLGAKEIDFSYLESSRPALGNNVTIGAGAKVLGGLTLGNHCRIGANAVVLDSIPDNSLAVGIPAKIIKQMR